MSKFLEWKRRRHLEELRQQADYLAALNSIPCQESFTYSTSIGGPIECGTHGGMLSFCPNRNLNQESK